MDGNSSLGIDGKTEVLTPIPCTSQVPCDQDESSQPVPSYALLCARNKISNVLLNDALTNELRTEIEAIKEQVEKASTIQQTDSEKAQNEIQQLREKCSNLQEEHEREKKDLYKKLEEYNISTHESRISQIESQLLVKQIEERKEMRRQRSESNKAFPDSTKISQYSYDRKDSGLSLTSVNSTDDPEYIITDDQGYGGSTPGSRSTSYTELHNKVSKQAESILDPVPESP